MPLIVDAPYLLYAKAAGLSPERLTVELMNGATVVVLISLPSENPGRTRGRSISFHASS